MDGKSTGQHSVRLVPVLRIEDNQKQIFPNARRIHWRGVRVAGTVWLATLPSSADVIGAFSRAVRSRSP